MKGEFRIVGYSGVKSFVGKQGDSIKYARLDIRELDGGESVQVKCSPDFDFKPWLDKTAMIVFKVLSDGIIRAERVDSK